MGIRTLFLITLLMLLAPNAVKADTDMKYRGIVYDVGLQYNPGQYSVDSLTPEVLSYDMNVIANILRANAVRIEGEEIDRLVKAAVTAQANGLKIFFNPWMMGPDVETVVPYMAEAAKAAERLRLDGADITFVTGCEFSLFNKGIFEGDNVNERLASLSKIGQYADQPEKLKAAVAEMGSKLNSVLGRIVKAVRENFKGDVIYSSGTWEPVDWSLFDAVGVDYYRDTQTDEEYVAGLQRYLATGKPVWVMEVGCCTFEGAAPLGGGGFTICQGVDADGNGIYAGGKAPKRSEREQADYIERQIRLLNGSGIEGIFIFEFSFPIAPYREKGYDADLTAYPIVKSFPADDPRSLRMPPWQPKEAFYRLGATYLELENKESWNVTPSPTSGIL